MLEKPKRSLEEFICVIFMEVSKTFNTINHDFLLLKLHAYGALDKALNLACSVVKERKQTVRINNNFTSVKKYR